MSISGIGAASAAEQLQRPQQVTPKVQAKAAEEVTESHQQEAAETGRVDIKA
jgi:hypothetical protein